MSNALDNLVNEASNAANTFQAPAVQTAPAGGAVQAYSKPSMGSMLDGGGMSVDSFLKLNAEGFRLGDEMNGLLDEIVVTIDVSEVTPIKQARFELNGATTFIKSYDGVTTSDGQNFANTVATRSAVPGVKPSGVYDSAEIPMTLTEAVDDPKKGGKTFPAGFRVGYTPSLTGFSEFRAFLKKLRSIDPSLLNETVTAKVTHKVRKNTKGNTWGVLDFELIEAAE